MIIAGAGFAAMAWALAQMRAFPLSPPDLPAPCPRAPLYSPSTPATAEYYRIIDKAAACFEHRDAIFMGGTVHGPYRCML